MMLAQQLYEGIDVGEHHRLLGREAELSSRLVLERRRDERWRRIASAFAARHRLDDEGRTVERGDDGARRLLVPKIGLLAGVLAQRGYEGRRPLGLEAGVQ